MRRTKQIKLVRVYLADWNTLNDYLLHLQLARKQRLNLCDVVHAVLEAIQQDSLTTLKAELERA